MTDHSTFDQLTALFRESGPAHHQAYIETNGDDPEWPLWYANYLHERLNNLLDTKLTKSELVYWLISVEKDRQKNTPQAYWPDYYAHFFLEQVR